MRELFRAATALLVLVAFAAGAPASIVPRHGNDLPLPRLSTDPVGLDAIVRVEMESVPGIGDAADPASGAPASAITVTGTATVAPSPAGPDCDRQTADRYDLDRPAEVDPVEAIADPEAAVGSCRAAAAQAPVERRYLYELAVALESAGQPPAAMEAAQQAADAGSAAAINFVALRLYGFAGDRDGARRRFATAAALGYLPAMNNLAALIEADGDVIGARRWYLAAANAGFDGAYFAAGVYLYLGTGGARDYAGALTWFELAADGGDGAAAYLAGVMYAAGQGSAADATEAAGYFVQAIERRDADAIDAFAVNAGAYPPEVRVAVQQFLIDAGLLDGPPDGIFGPLTLAALQRWATGR